MPDLTPSQLSNTVQSMRGFAGISCTVSLVTIITVIAYKRLRSTLNTILACLAFSDFGLAFVLCFGTNYLKNQKVCYGLGIIAEYFFNASSSWNLILFFYIFAFVVFGGVKAEWVFRIGVYYAWLLPLLLTGIGFIAEKANPKLYPLYGSSSLQCWITGNGIFWWYRIYIYFIPLWIHYFGIFVFYLCVAYVVHRRSKESRVSENDTAKKTAEYQKMLFWKGSFIVFSFFACSVPASAYRICATMPDTCKYNPNLYMIQGIMQSWNGVWNGLVFALFTHWYGHLHLNETVHNSETKSTDSTACSMEHKWWVEPGKKILKTSEV
ncbi:hypothetical protein HDU99_000116 [Rhizoclosmatium hyalinum]|nr:hypothetical protein HDU99_000116 [Rhizoclosmatium hyalinum]